MNHIEERIEQIKAKLILDQPYFGSIASSLKSKQNDDIPTFSTTPENFEYNDEYIEFISDDQLSFLLTNSAMHQALGYTNRKEGRLDWLWKMSQDYCINSLLVNNGLDIPDGLNYDSSFDGHSAESIYTILENETDEDKHTPQKVDQIKYEKMPQTNDYDTDPIEDIHEQMISKARLHGDLPLGIEMLIPNINSNFITWEDELYTVIENSVKFDYRLIPPNKRYISQGVALPSLSGEKVKLVIAIDSSGSIDPINLSKFLNEVDSIMNTFENYEIDLLIADAKVHEHHILYPGDSIEYNIKGGGGTNFATTFEYIEDNIDNITLMIYFTDGAGTYPDEEPGYDTLWVLTNNQNIPPFGRTILLN